MKIGHLGHLEGVPPYEPWLLTTYKSWDDPPSSHVVSLKIVDEIKPFEGMRLSGSSMLPSRPFNKKSKKKSDGCLLKVDQEIEVMDDTPKSWAF